eukprot:9067406-Pyramimonas_sp.AAC.1
MKIMKMMGLNMRRMIVMKTIVKTSTKMMNMNGVGMNMQVMNMMTTMVNETMFLVYLLSATGPGPKRMCKPYAARVYPD